MKKILCALLAAVSCLGFAACVPMTMDQAEEKMKKEGYTVIAYTDDEEAEGLVGGFNATKMEGILDIDNLTALYFSSIKEAKAYYEDLNQTNAIQDGKWVYWGTEDAIEDFID